MTMAVGKAFLEKHFYQRLMKIVKQNKQVPN